MMGSSRILAVYNIYKMAPSKSVSITDVQMLHNKSLKLTVTRVTVIANQRQTPRHAAAA